MWRSIRAGSETLPGWPRCRSRTSAPRRFRSSSEANRPRDFAQSQQRSAIHTIQVILWPRNLRAAAPLLRVPFSGSAMNILDPQGPIGAADKTILIDSLAIMLAIVLPTIIAVFGFAYWYRASNPKARYLPHGEYSGRIELVVWSIPTLTVILLGGVAWIGAHQLDPAKAVEGSGKPLTIQAVSLDWKWLFIYPDQQVATINTLTVPKGVPLQFQLTSASVMNVFFIPQFGSMIYTMNGMTTRLNLRADSVGTYGGLAAHFSGDGFSDMHFFDVHVVPPEEFSKWAQDASHSE